MPGKMAFYGWFEWVRSRCQREKAQTMAEYAVVLAVITPAIILAYGLLSGKVGQLIDAVRALL
jgi:Flp pilus assembly pilin Flp